MTRKKLRRPPAASVVRKDSANDYTGATASQRVLHINLFVLKYGTDDRLQGAALFLALVLLLFLLLFSVAALLWGRFENVKDFSQWIVAAFTMCVGVAIGRSNANSGDAE